MSWGLFFVAFRVHIMVDGSLSFRSSRSQLIRLGLYSSRMLSNVTQTHEQKITRNDDVDKNNTQTMLEGRALYFLTVRAQCDDGRQHFAFLYHHHHGQTRSEELNCNQGHQHCCHYNLLLHHRSHNPKDIHHATICRRYHHHHDQASARRNGDDRRRRGNGKEGQDGR